MAIKRLACSLWAPGTAVVHWGGLGCPSCAPSWGGSRAAHVAYEKSRNGVAYMAEGTTACVAVSNQTTHVAGRGAGS